MTNSASYFPLPPPMPVPVTPDVETWRAMTLAEREAFIISVNEALSDPVKRALEEARNNAENAIRKAEQATRDSARNISRSLLKVLAYRNVTCSPANLARIESCTDFEVLDKWLDRAFEATTESDLFGRNE